MKPVYIILLLVVVVALVLYANSAKAQNTSKLTSFNFSI